MAEFRAYESWGEMQADMRRAEAQARAHMTDEQYDLMEATTDRYWVQFVPEYGITIYGHAWGDKTIRERTEAISDDREEIEDEIASLKEARTRGYLFGTAYSTVEPDGEMGSTHVSQVQSISKEMFEQARSNGWKT